MAHETNKPLGINIFTVQADYMGLEKTNQKVLISKKI